MAGVYPGFLLACNRLIAPEAHCVSNGFRVLAACPIPQPSFALWNLA